MRAVTTIQGPPVLYDVIRPVVEFIGHHSAWTFPIIFITAFGESFIFVSLFVPGTAILIAAGLLVPGGTVPLFPLVSGAILGAVLGDAISWWLGSRYGEHLEAVWPFRRYPRLMARSKAFFRRYGVAGVFLGRFFGPLRASIPLTAGIAKMPAGPFWLSNVGSAVIWAPALLLPGSAAAVALHDVPESVIWRWGLGVLALAGITGFIWYSHRRRAEGRERA